jgi:hypothetical protein
MTDVADSSRPWEERWGRLLRNSRVLALTIRGRRGSVDKRMKVRTNTRRGAWSATAIALVTVLALLVAPICGSLCAAKVCGPSAAQGQCHEMAQAGTNGGATIAAVGKACKTPELSAVISRGDERPSANRQVRTEAAAKAIGDALRLAATGASESPGGWRDARTRLVAADPSLVTTILRI